MKKLVFAVLFALGLSLLAFSAFAAAVTQLPVPKGVPATAKMQCTPGGGRAYTWETTEALYVRLPNGKTVTIRNQVPKAAVEGASVVKHVAPLVTDDAIYCIKQMGKYYVRGVSLYLSIGENVLQTYGYDGKLRAEKIIEYSGNGLRLFHSGNELFLYDGEFWLWRYDEARNELIEIDLIGESDILFEGGLFTPVLCQNNLYIRLRIDIDGSGRWMPRWWIACFDVLSGEFIRSIEIPDRFFDAYILDNHTSDDLYLYDGVSFYVLGEKKFERLGDFVIRDNPKRLNAPYTLVALGNNAFEIFGLRGEKQILQRMSLSFSAQEPKTMLQSPLAQDASAPKLVRKLELVDYKERRDEGIYASRDTIFTFSGPFDAEFLNDPDAEDAERIRFSCWSLTGERKFSVLLDTRAEGSSKLYYKYFGAAQGKYTYVLRITRDWYIQHEVRLLALDNTGKKVFEKTIAKPFKRKHYHEDAWLCVDAKTGNVHVFYEDNVKGASVIAHITLSSSGEVLSAVKTNSAARGIPVLAGHGELLFVNGGSTTSLAWYSAKDKLSDLQMIDISLSAWNQSPTYVQAANCAYAVIDGRVIRLEKGRIQVVCDLRKDPTYRKYSDLVEEYLSWFDFGYTLKHCVVDDKTILVVFGSAGFTDGQAEEICIYSME